MKIRRTGDRGEEGAAKWKKGAPSSNHGLFGKRQFFRDGSELPANPSSRSLARSPLAPPAQAAGHTSRLPRWRPNYGRGGSRKNVFGNNNGGMKPMLLWLLAPLPPRWSAGRRSNIEALWLTASDDGALTTELTTNRISFGSCLGSDHFGHISQISIRSKVTIRLLPHSTPRPQPLRSDTLPECTKREPQETEKHNDCFND